MTQYTELTADTRRGASGVLVPPKTAIGNVHEDTLLPETVVEIVALDLRPTEAAFDRGFTTQATLATMAGLGARIFIAGSPQNDGSRRTRRRWPPMVLDVRAASPTSSARMALGAPGGATGAKIWAA